MFRREPKGLLLLTAFVLLFASSVAMEHRMRTMRYSAGTTDAAGGYGPWWLGSGTYTVRVSSAGYVDDAQSVGISAGMTTTYDVMLVLNAPQIAVAPLSLAGWSRGDGR